MKTDLEKHSAVGYGATESERYRIAGHGPDGNLFLDPYIGKFIKNIPPGSNVVDVGAGAGPFSVQTAKEAGSLVASLDNSLGMVERAKDAVINSGLSDRIAVFRGDVQRLPFADNNFQAAASINVGCNLTGDALYRHLLEMRRVISPDGEILFTAPINLGKVFTSGSKKVWDEISEAMSSTQLEIEQTGDGIQALVQRHLGGLADLYRGTFVIKDGRFKMVVNDQDQAPLTKDLMVNEQDLEDGEAILRKIPGLIVPNNYHSEDTYVSAFKEARMDVQGNDSDHFIDESAHREYNSIAAPNRQLGEEYVESGPFAIYTLAVDK